MQQAVPKKRVFSTDTLKMLVRKLERDVEAFQFAPPPGFLEEAASHDRSSWISPETFRGRKIMYDTTDSGWGPYHVRAYLQDEVDGLVIQSSDCAVWRVDWQDRTIVPLPDGEAAFLRAADEERSQYVVEGHAVRGS